MASAWNAYIKMLLDTKNVTKAAIFGIKGGAPWATSAGFEPNFAAVDAAFKDLPGCFAKGVTVKASPKEAPIKYLALQADEDCVYARKDGTGIIFVKTKLAYIVCYHSDEIQAGNFKNAVFTVQDYLKKSNY